MMIKRLFTLQKTEHEVMNEQLSFYVDEQLSARERARVESHLGHCEVCRQELRTLRWTKQLLRETPVVELPRSFVIREADVAERAAVGTRRPLFVAQWATAAVALLLVLVLAGDMLAGVRASRQPARPQVSVYGQEQATAAALAEAESEAQEPQAEATKEAEGERSMMRATSLATPADDTSTQADETTPAEKVMGALPAPTGTQPSLAAAAESAPEAEPTAEPLAATEPPQEALGKGGGGQPEAVPSPPAVVQEEPAGTPALLQRGEAPVAAQPLVAQPLAGSAWRLAELGLAVALAGLAVTMLWLRRRG